LKISHRHIQAFRRIQNARSNVAGRSANVINSTNFNISLPVVPEKKKPAVSTAGIHSQTIRVCIFS